MGFLMMCRFSLKGTIGSNNGVPFQGTLGFYDLWQGVGLSCGRDQHTHSYCGRVQ